MISLAQTWRKVNRCSVAIKFTEEASVYKTCKKYKERSPNRYGSRINFKYFNKTKLFALENEHSLPI